MPEILFQKDLWLSQTLGRESYHLAVSDGLRCGAGEAMEPLKALMRERRVFVYAKIPISDYLGACALSDLRFRIVETSLTLFKKGGDPPRPGSETEVRFALPGDRDGVAEVARRSFIYSRFHTDPLIPEGAANGIKSQWASNFFAGKRGDQMVVASLQGEVAGFLQLLFSGKDLVIDLIAVLEKFRRRGVAADMIGFARSSLGAFDRLLVGTQVANIPSLTLYSSMGFLPLRAAHVFHYHNL